MLAKNILEENGLFCESNEISFHKDKKGPTSSSAHSNPGQMQNLRAKKDSGYFRQVLENINLENELAAVHQNADMRKRKDSSFFRDVFKHLWKQIESCIWLIFDLIKF